MARLGIGIFLSILGPALELRYRPSDSKFQFDLGFGKLGSSFFASDYFSGSDDYDSDEDYENQDDIEDSHYLDTIYYPSIYLGYNLSRPDSKWQCSFGATGVFLFTNDSNIQGCFGSAFLATFKANYNFGGKIRFNYSTSFPIVCFDMTDSNSTPYFMGDAILSQPYATGLVLLCFSTIGLTYYF